MVLSWKKSDSDAHQAPTSSDRSIGNVGTRHSTQLLCSKLLSAKGMPPEKIIFGAVLGQGRFGGFPQT